MIVLCLVSSGVFFGVFLTGNDALLGLLAGFATGLFYILWLFRAARKTAGTELSGALRSYRKNFFFRLGVVTFIVAVIGGFHQDWLFYLVIGIAVGVIIPLIMAIRQQLQKERG
jgi:hypothetical protein